MSIEAMKRALEALETEQTLRRGYTYSGGKRIVSTADDAIESLRAAIQQAESEPVVKASDVMMIRRLMKSKKLTPDTDEGWEEALRVFTHPAPGVPEKLTVDPSGVSGTADEGYVAGWNACRDAMLTAAQAQKGKESNGYQSNYCN